MSANGTGIGASVKRKEDQRFLTGRGRYTDDINLPGQLYAHILRSGMAHATIGTVHTDAAKAAPGVHAVFTGKDMEGVGGIPTGWLIHSKDGSPMVEPPHPALAVDKVRYVGDCVAIVVAETREQAKSAANLIDVEREELPAVASIGAAEADGAPLVHDEADGNVCYDWEVGDKAATDAAFDAADHVVSIDVVNNRLIPNAIEPRAAIANFDPATDEYTLYTTTQNPHLVRLLLGAFVLGLPEHKLRIVAPDVGGGFGSKIPHYAEEAILTWTAGKLGRPVKWTCERIDAFKSDTHGRDHISTAKLALDADGHFLGLHVSTKANLGAYLSTFAPAYRRTCTASSSRDRTPRRRSIARSSRSSPTRCRSTRCAARGGPRRPICWSAWSRRLPWSSGWTAWRFAARTSSASSRTRRRSRCSTTRATTTRR